MSGVHLRRAPLTSSERRSVTTSGLRCRHWGRPGQRYRPTSGRSCGCRCWEVSESVLVTRVCAPCRNLGSENSHAMSFSAGIETNLDERVILLKVRLVQDVGFEVVVDQRLPSCRQTEDVEAINTGKVLPKSASATCLRCYIGLHSFSSYI